MKFSALSFSLNNTIVNTNTALRVNASLSKDSGAFFVNDDIVTINLPSGIAFGSNLTVKSFFATAF
jgi:hypothetical protein